MKVYLSLIAAAALSLTACSKEAAPEASAPAASEAVAASAASEAPASEAASAPAAATSAPAADTQAAAPAAGECETVIESDDAMKFNASEINVNSSCKEYKITLKHTGKMPKTAMGHNIVVSKASDAEGVLKDGAQAGADKDYVKADDARVVAHTKLIGGGEESSLTFDPAKLSKSDAYEFYCSFPGHYGIMKGTLKLS